MSNTLSPKIRNDLVLHKLIKNMLNLKTKEKNLRASLKKIILKFLEKCTVANYLLLLKIFEKN